MRDDRDSTIPADPDALLTYRQAAAILRVCERSVWTAVNCGEISAVRIGRSVRIRRRTLLDWIDRLEQQGQRR